MANRSYIKERLIKREWIILETWQSQELHDIALRLSVAAASESFVADEETNERLKTKRLTDAYYELSDAIQRKNEVSVRQLSLLQRGLRINFHETLYVRGLEYWLISNEKKMLQKKKERKTKLSY